MIQRLGEEMGGNWERAVVAALVAALLGIVYAYGVHVVYRTDPEHPYSSVLVAFGVGLTLIAAAIVVPVQWVATLALLFVVTGLPQIIGSMLREAERRHRLLRDAQRNIEDTLRS